MSGMPGDDRSLRLLQALSDKNQAVIDKSLEAEDLRQWVNNEIDKKKVQMEYEILEREKTHEINRLLRQIEHREAVGGH